MGDPRGFHDKFDLDRNDKVDLDRNDKVDLDRNDKFDLDRNDKFDLDRNDKVDLDRNDKVDLCQDLISFVGSVNIHSNIFLRRDLGSSCKIYVEQRNFKIFFPDFLLLLPITRRNVYS